MVVAAVPLVPVLPDEGGVMPGLDVADVVDHGEERVGVVPVGRFVGVCRRKKKQRIIKC